MMMGLFFVVIVLVFVMCCLLCGGGVVVEGGFIVEFVMFLVFFGFDVQKFQVFVILFDGLFVFVVIVVFVFVYFVVFDFLVLIFEQSFVFIGDGKYELGFLLSDFFLGKYKFWIDVLLDDDKGFLDIVIVVIVFILVFNVKVGVVEGDSVFFELDVRLEFKQMMILLVIYLQKFKFVFEVSGLFGVLFKFQQVMLKLRGESGVEQIFFIKFLIGNFYEFILDFIKLVEKLNY